MLRRDEFVDRYSSLNNKQTLDLEIVELEQYVDTQLLAAENILNMINQDQLTGTQDEVVTNLIENESIHNINTIVGNAGRKGGIDDVEFAIWKGKLLTNDTQDATLTPWLNKTLSTVVSGILTVILPEKTNKNAAKILVDKYLGPVDVSNLTTKDKESNFGFWRKIPQLDGNTADDPAAVELLWDNVLQLFKMKFKLNS